jgi:hypothetical protein
MTRKPAPNCLKNCQGDELRADVERLTAAVEDAVETLEAMGLHYDNPLYQRLRAALEPKP